jgi:hypothetical protein
MFLPCIYTLFINKSTALNQERDTRVGEHSKSSYSWAEDFHRNLMRRAFLNHHALIKYLDVNCIHFISFAYVSPSALAEWRSNLLKFAQTARKLAQKLPFFTRFDPNPPTLHRFSYHRQAWTWSLFDPPSRPYLSHPRLPEPSPPPPPTHTGDRSLFLVYFVPSLPRD